MSGDLLSKIRHRKFVTLLVFLTCVGFVWLVIRFSPEVVAITLAGVAVTVVFLARSQLVEDMVRGFKRRRVIELTPDVPQDSSDDTVAEPGFFQRHVWAPRSFELLAWGWLLIIAFAGHGHTWSWLLIGVVAVWALWRLQVLRGLGITWLSRRLLLWLGVIAIAAPLIAAIYLLKTRLPHLFLRLLRIVWWPLRVTRLYLVPVFPLALVIWFKRRRLDGQRAEELFLASRISDDAERVYFLTIASLQRRFEGQIRKLAYPAVRLSRWQSPEGFEQDAADGLMKLLTEPQQNEVQFLIEGDIRSAEAHAESGRTGIDNAMNRLLWELERKAKKLTKHAQQTLTLADGLAVPASLTEFHGAWARGIQQVMQGAEQCERQVKEFEKRTPTDKDQGYLPNRPFDPRWLDDAVRLLENGLDELDDAALQHRRALRVELNETDYRAVLRKQGR